jgi:hypothetical protein
MLQKCLNLNCFSLKQQSFAPTKICAAGQNKSFCKSHLADVVTPMAIVELQSLIQESFQTDSCSRVQSRLKRLKKTP